MVTGLLLSGTASALPERWQEPGLYVGVGLTFASIAAVLLNLLMAARPEWRRTATIIGMVLGPLPILVVAWPNLHDRPLDYAPASESQVAVAPSRSQAAAAPPSAVLPAVPRARSETASPARPALPPPDPVLTEVADILNSKARPALSRAVTVLMQGRVRAAKAEALENALDSVAHDMEEVRVSLRQVQTRHSERQSELAAVIGDTAALEALISKLHELHDSLQSAPEDNPLRQPGNDAGSVTTPVGQWITDCNQRIVDHAKVLVTAS